MDDKKGKNTWLWGIDRSGFASGDLLFDRDGNYQLNISASSIVTSIFPKAIEKAERVIEVITPNDDFISWFCLSTPQPG
jgi:hypothetical protein